MYKIILLVGLMTASAHAEGFLMLESQEGSSIVLPKEQLICILSKKQIAGVISYEIAIYIKNSLSIFPKNIKGELLKTAPGELAPGELAPASLGTEFIPYQFSFKFKDNKYILKSGKGLFRGTDKPNDYKFQAIKLKAVISQLIGLKLIPETPPFKALFQKN